MGTLAKLAIAKLAITARVTTPQPTTNTGTVSHADQFDPDPADNTDDATVTPQQADLEVTKAVDKPAPNVGDIVDVHDHPDQPRAGHGHQHHPPRHICRRG